MFHTAHRPILSPVYTHRYLRREMSSFRTRPRFSQTVEMNQEEIQEKIVQFINSESSPCVAKVFPDFVRIRILEEDQHFWSPRLTLSLYREEENTTLIKGVYGPNANVWAIFLYGYLITGFLAAISGIFAISQWIIGVELTALWYFVPAIIAITALYITAQLGQKMGAQQTFLLHQAYESAVGTTADIR